MQPESANDANAPTLAGQTLTFPTLPALEAGKETTYKVRVRALRAADVKFVVELQSAELATPLREEEPTTIFGEAQPVVPASVQQPPPAPPASPLPPPSAPPLPGPPGG